MILSKIGRKYEVISDSDGIWAPGTVVIAIEEDSTAPWCVLEEDYIEGDPDLRNMHCMEMDELRDLTPVAIIPKRKIEVEISTNRVGSEQTATIEVDADVTDEEIDQIAWETACDMLNFTWRDA